LPEYRLRLFLQALGSDPVARELVVGLPVRFHGFPGKPVPEHLGPIYQATAFFPGVLPDDGMSSRDPSEFVALLRLINSIEQFCIDFEKAGGKFYFPMPDDPTKPFLGEPMRARPFFRL